MNPLPKANGPALQKTATDDRPVEPGAQSSGLDGVIAVTTRLSHIDGLAGRLLIGGIPVEELAPRASVEEAVLLLWEGALPTAPRLDSFRDELLAARTLPEAALTVIKTAVEAGAEPLEAVMSAVPLLTPAASSVKAGDAPLLRASHDATCLVARLPLAVAAAWRLTQGASPVAAPHDLGYAASYLFALSGERPPPALARALETYLVTVMDHGLNASTFVARIVMSTHSDMASAVTAALGALKGPLHGGAPGPALELITAVDNPNEVERDLRRRLDAGERLMGFGHRVYKVRDPRAAVLESVVAGLASEPGPHADILAAARHVEATATRLLEEYKPGRGLRANVEFYTALVLHAVGLPEALFTPTFAVGRVAGWTAHGLEQLSTGRLIRPASQFDGPMLSWQDLELRVDN